MTSVRFYGWKEGLRKVALNKLFQGELGITLAPAKELVDRILSGDDVVVTVASFQAAEALVEKARELGAECEIVSYTESG